MKTGFRHYAVHGMSLKVEAGGPSLADCLDRILSPFAMTASSHTSFFLRMCYGVPRPAKSAPRGMREVWRGLPPGGCYTVFYAGGGHQRIELPGLAHLAVNLPRRAAQVIVRRGAEWCLSRSLITPLLCEFLSEAGQHVIHAAGLAFGDGANSRAVLLAAASGLGKTTTALALARAGMRFMADDASFAGRADGEFSKGIAVWGLPRPCKVHKKTFMLMPWLDKLPRRPAPTDDEHLIDFALLPGANALQTARPGLIFFLDRRNRREHRVRPLDKVTALIRLARENLRAPDPSAEGPAGRTFEALAELVERSDSYRLSVGPRIETLYDKIIPLFRKRKP